MTRIGCDGQAWACVAAGSAPLLAGGAAAYALGCLALGALLTADFARYFTPGLNVARGLPEFHASSDSASWPDAAVWRRVRRSSVGLLSASTQQAYAQVLLRRLLQHVWLAGRVAYALGLAATTAYLIR